MGGILSDRETPVWLFAKQPDLNVREFFVISTPAEFESTPGRVKAAFSAIEHVQELPDGKIQWVMALVVCVHHYHTCVLSSLTNIISYRAMAVV